MPSRFPRLRLLFPPLLWFCAAAAAVFLSQRAWLWPEIFAGWGLVCLNAGVAGWGERRGRGGDPAQRTIRMLGWQVVRAGLFTVIIIFVFRLAFLRFNAFLFASFAGYLAWSTGRILRLHLHSLR